MITASRRASATRRAARALNQDHSLHASRRLRGQKSLSRETVCPSRISEVCRTTFACPSVAFYVQLEVKPLVQFSASPTEGVRDLDDVSPSIGPIVAGLKPTVSSTASVDRVTVTIGLAVVYQNTHSPSFNLSSPRLGLR
ncbi:hypothetical protein MES5069_450055 [Mesorhizobium escarrei]|uniref:Uncharacterized protein n=1 Tax=Mesorhizobium escarrei TaxID=666018 RepID=A0ABM9E7I3_9HYPH|nr:hypothetical protein MES5069_450055 [Mesorhizobium escarrei]